MGNRIKGLAHIGLYVRDIERTKKFYAEMLGFVTYFECVSESPEGDILIAFARNGDCVLEIVQLPVQKTRQDGPFDHIALKVSNIEEVKKELESRGIIFEEDEITYAAHVFPPKGSKWILFRGPDNEHIELNELM